MTPNLDPLLKVVVEPLGTTSEYDVSIEGLGKPIVRNRIQVDPIAHYNLGYGLPHDPLEPVLKNIREHLGSSSQIDLYLPQDPVAALDWEELNRGRVIRCTTRDIGFRRTPVSGSVRVGFVSTVPIKSNIYAGMANSVMESVHGAVEPSYLDVNDWNLFSHEVRPGRFHAMHVLVETELDPDGPMAVIGGKRIPLEQLVKTVAQPGTRVVVLQDVKQKPNALAALRWGAQSLPNSCETSMVVCSAEPSAGFVGEMQGCYESILRDEPLTRAVAPLYGRYPGGASVIAHGGTVPGLGLIEDLEFRNRRQEQILLDYDRLGESTKRRAWSGSIDFKRAAISKAAASIASAPLAELTQKESLPPDVGDDLKERVKEIITNSEGDHPRYPAVWFYYVDAASRTPIPDTETLAWPTPNGVGLEFHFWLDIVKTGIASITETPEFHKPERFPYPLKLRITVWSEHFEFGTNEHDITLEAAGPTEHAIFPVEKLPPAPRQAELFVFVRHEGALIAAFRVDADITERPERHEGAQSVQHAYVSSEWFRFEEAPTGSALTIFITKRHGSLQLFTLKLTGNPWATLGPTENGLYEKNKEIYKAVQMLARRAEEASKANENFSFVKEGKPLAKLGYPLFSDLFFQGENEDAGKFADEYVRSLPEGSTLTIAIGRDAQNLFVPWGLLYDRDPPFDHFDVPEMNGFLGYRYNLVVRPSTPYDGYVPKHQLPVRMGAAWLEHEETEPLRAFYKGYEDANKLKIEPVRVQDHKLPALAQNEYDLIEFFCHGHTKLGTLFSPEEVAQMLEGYAKSTGGGTKNPLLMAIDDSGDSLLDLSGGFVTLASLADSLKSRMPGRPLILLSMCESAQVSASGIGFVPLFLRRGARAVIGTEGPTLWKLSREMDTQIVAKLLEGQTISQAFYATRKELVKTNMLALIYSLYGDPGAKLLNQARGDRE